MLTIIKSKLSRFFSDGIDTWTGKNSPTVKADRSVSKTPDAINPQTLPAQPTVQRMRNDLIQSEVVEEILSKKSERVHIVKSGSEIIGSEEKRSFTDEGLITDSDQYFLQTSEGRFIKGKELHGGGECYACQRYSDRVNFCDVCRKLVCVLHSVPHQNLTVCPSCWRKLKFNEDSWEEIQGK